MEKVLDLKNLACPGPVIETKKTMENPEVNRVIAYVDNAVAKENLLRLASSLGVKVNFSQEKDIYKVILEKTDGVIIHTKDRNKMDKPFNQDVAQGKAYFITGDEMGRGDRDLGCLLIKGFLYTLTQMEFPPKAVIMVNSAVKLACENLETVEHLKTLEAKGTKVVSCGTCLNYHHLTDQLKAGIIGNMYDIVEELEGSLSVTI